MSLELVNYVVQLISTVALLVSVIYLGRQTHLIAKGQLAQMHQARSEQFQEIMLRMVDPELAKFSTSAIHGDKSLPDEQIRMFYFLAASVLRIFEELFRQNREGTIAGDRWNSSKQTLEGIMRSPGYRGVYVILKGSLDKEFAELIDGFIKARPESQAIDLAALWRNAVTDPASGNAASA